MLGCTSPCALFPSPLFFPPSCLVAQALHSDADNSFSVSLGASLPTMCGDWALADICSLWPELVARELATFEWPIREESELLRLLACVYASPSSVCGGERTAACRAENERVHRELTLSVDTQTSLVPGMHACMDMRLVLHRKRWHRAYIFPPCTHAVKLLS